MSKTRRREMWISTNRVLTGGTPKPRHIPLNSKKLHPHRNPNFETSETKMLISLWGDPKVQKTLITTHRKHPVIAKIAEEMQNRGYDRTPEEINTRIKNLKCFYNRIKKELDAGLIPYPTWKHFPSMDKIMTTSVFSVRPGETPKPSPRFKMERDSTASDTRSEESYDDDESFPAEMLLTQLAEEEDCIGIDMDDFDGNENDIVENEKERKERVERELDIDVEEVIVPKEEPIEVYDDDEEIPVVNERLTDGDNSSDIFPKLSAYLQLASNAPSSSAATKATNNKIITTAAGSTSASPSSISESNPSTNHGMKISQPMVLAQQQKPQGKISLVPTNILLKPQQQQIQLRSPTPHIIYKSTLGGNASIATSGATTAQMPNGMKVLLVNTLPNGSVAIANGTANDAQSKLITSNAMKGNCITSTMTNVNQAKSKFHNQHNQKAATAENTAGFRSLLTQLISVQNQNLEISRQRLEVERQRLDFEKSVAERIMAALPNIFTPANNNSEVQEPETATTVPLLVPKIEKED